MDDWITYVLILIGAFVFLMFVIAVTGCSAAM